MRIELWMLILGIVLVFPKHLSAQNTQPEISQLQGPIGEVCGAFEVPMDQDQLNWLKVALINKVTARNFGLVNRVKLTTIEDSQDLLPTVVGGAEPTLAVGNGFLQNLCLAMVFQDRHSDASEFRRRRMRADFSECLRLFGKQIICLRKITQGMFDENLPWVGESQKREYVRDVRSLTFSAAQFILAHEAAHIVFRAPRSNFFDEVEDEEYEADIAAYSSVLTDQSAPAAPLFVFATQWFIDDVAKVERYSTHEQTACRFERTKDILGATLVNSLRINNALFNEGYLALPGGEEIDYEEIWHNIEKINFARGTDIKCELTSNIKIAELAADLQDIAGTYRDFTGNLDGSEVVGISEILDNLNIRTKEGARLRALLSGTSRAAAIYESEAYAAFALKRENGEPLSVDDLQLVRAMQISLGKFFREKAGDFFPAVEFFNLLHTNLQLDIVSLPAGTTLKQGNEFILAEMSKIDQGHDWKALLRSVDYADKMIGLDKATYVYSTAIPLSVQLTKVDSLIALGRCEEAKAAMADGGRELASYMPSQELTDAAICDKFRRALLSRQSRILGWTDSARYLEQ